MNNDIVEVVGPERTAFASRLPVGAEHEVIHDQLAPALEQVGQALFAVGPIKDIAFLDALPRQIASLLTELVTQSGKFLFFRQEFLAGFRPFMRRDDPVLVHRRFSLLTSMINGSFSRRPFLAACRGPIAGARDASLRSPPTRRRGR